MFAGWRAKPFLPGRKGAVFGVGRRGSGGGSRSRAWGLGSGYRIAHLLAGASEQAVFSVGGLQGGAFIGIDDGFELFGEQSCGKESEHHAGVAAGIEFSDDADLPDKRP